MCILGFYNKLMLFFSLFLAPSFLSGCFVQRADLNHDRPTGVILLLHHQKVKLNNLKANSKITLRIPITNAGGKALRIIKMKTSCECLQSELGELEIPPDSTSYLPLLYFAPGQVGKAGPYYLHMETNDPARPLLNIQVSANITHTEGSVSTISRSIELPTTPVPCLYTKSRKLDFGHVYYHEKKIEKWFFKNVGNAPLHIEKVGVSCGKCIKFLGKMPKEIPPQIISSLAFEFDPKGYNGKVNQRVLIFSNDPVNSTCQLDLVAKVNPSFHVFPQTMKYLAGQPSKFLLVLDDQQLSIQDLKIKSNCFEISRILPRNYKENEKRYIVEGVFNTLGSGDCIIEIWLGDHNPLILQCYDSTYELDKGVISDRVGKQDDVVFGNAHSTNNKNTKGKFVKNLVEWYDQKIPLAQGLYLVAMLSTFCEDCAKVVGILNNLSANPKSPLIVGLLLGEEETLRSFRQMYNPSFPNQLVTASDFFNLIDAEPPRFILVKDGRQIQCWGKNLPTESELFSAVRMANREPMDVR